MNHHDLNLYVPDKLRDAYEPLALLKAAEEGETLLLRHRVTGGKAVLKRGCGKAAFSEELYHCLTPLGGDGIPRIYDLCADGDASYILREYIEGETLLNYMQRRGPLPIAEAAEIGAAVCRVLQRLHGLNPPVIHRDIKADNIIRTPDGRYVLIDFGIARFYSSGGARDTHVLGTPFSAPPEQFGYRQTDPRADIYAVGVLLHELTTGEYMLDKGEPPAALRRIVRRCTRFDPKDRYSDAGTLGRALKRVAGRQKRGHRVAIIAAALVIGIVAGLWTAGSDRLSSGARYSFASPEIEAEVCRQLGLQPGSVTYGDLKKITSILMCGDSTFEEVEQLSIHGTEILVDWQVITARGTVDTLVDIPHFPNLKDLALCNQNLSDLSPLAGCPIERLVLHGNQISDVSPLSQCAALRLLYISDNPITHLDALAQCPVLWRLNIGATDIASLDELTGFAALSYLDVHDCANLTDLSALRTFNTLLYLSIRPVANDQLGNISALTQLEHLYLWGSPGMADLTPLAPLTHLRRLFVDMTALRSIEGIEHFEQLDYLDLRSGTINDLSPLLTDNQLEDLNVTSFTVQDWSALPLLPVLKRVYCTADQQDAIRAAFDEAWRFSVEIIVI